MNSQEFQRRLLAAYPGKVSSEVAGMLREIEERYFYDLLQAIESEYPSGYAIGPYEIRKSYDKIKAPPERPSFSVVKWICQVCSHQFMFQYCCDPAKNFIGVFQFCPECGFPPMVSLVMHENKVGYRGRQDLIDLFKATKSGLYNEMRKRRGFFDSEKDRASEFEALKTKGLLPTKEYEGGSNV